ncbi:hypothetical protein B0H17DRAFT_256110 [Mycena rosella]|uniref:Uncharacterized protein n=1 Tax=Mycena rosella TaxID=1033263 RepID=A0AAD7CWD5_MYCRO|nr:hypothetical protein B0H17DRAFT_256110 [Mycena rosella]
MPHTMPGLLSPSPSASDVESEPEDSALVFTAGMQSRLRRRPAVAVHARLHSTAESDSEPTALVCGVEEDVPAEEEWWDARAPARIPFLPLPLDSHVASSSSSPSTFFAQRKRRSTGCGGLAHAGARPARGHPAHGGLRWVGDSEGVPRTVVPLELRYFREADVVGLGLGSGRRRCGCTVEGVGCAICGNALGARHTPCLAHRITSNGTTRAEGDDTTSKGLAHYVFLPAAVSPPFPPSTSTTTSSATAGPSSPSHTGPALVDRRTLPLGPREPDAHDTDNPPDARSAQSTPRAFSRPAR